MKQEDKDLLLKDLCARSPYGVKCRVYNDTYIKTLSGVLSGNVYNQLYFIELDWKDCNGFVDVRYCKPYLFPLSSMTEEQKKEFNSYFASVPYYGDNIHIPYYSIELLIDFYNKHHLDWRGLIPMGLANDATGKNIY